MKLLVLFVFVILQAFVINGLKSYKGYKLYQVTINNSHQNKGLKEIYENGIYDFWTTPQNIGSTDILISENQEEFFLQFLHKYNIKNEILIQDLESLIENERNEIRKRKTEKPFMNWENYQTYDDIMIWIDELVNQYRTIASIEIIGKSTEGRDLKLVKISAPKMPGLENKKSIFIDGGFHAREWISPAFVTYVLNELLTNSHLYMEYLDKIDFYILPIVNPDGYYYTHTNDRNWRKTRSKHDTEGTCFGVDPNRNFGFHFGGAGTSDDKCNDIYRGPSAFSEPETKALSDYLLSEGKTANFSSYLTVHSYGQMWLIPYGYTSGFPKDFLELKDLANKAIKKITEYEGTPYVAAHSGNLLYATAGASDDWAKEVAGIKYSYTLELRPEGTPGFNLPPTEIIPVCKETFPAILEVAKHILIKP